MKRTSKRDGSDGNGASEARSSEARSSEARSSEPMSLEVFVAEHHVRLLRVAYLLTGQPADAEDLLAAAYARAWPRISRGKVDDPLAYLRRCLVNAASNRRRHLFVVADSQRRIARSIAASDEVAAADDRHLVAACLALLPLPQRQVVALRYLEDLSEAQTARALGIAEGTVKSRAARAIQTLRLALDEEVSP